MTITAAQHQRELDDAAELEAAAERAEQECREALLGMNRWHYSEQVRPWATRWQYVGEMDVTEAMYEQCHDELCLALARMDSDPLEAVRILKECRAKAVESVLKRMDFVAIQKANSTKEQAA